MENGKWEMQQKMSDILYQLSKVGERTIDSQKMLYTVQKSQ